MMSDEYLHRTRDGELIPISKLKDSHLLNILAMIHRRAQEGIQLQYGGGNCFDGIWYETETLYGEQAKTYLNHKVYATEAKLRKLGG